MQSRRRLKSHVGCGTQAYELDYALRWREFVSHFTARSNLCPPLAAGHRRDAITHPAGRRPRNFKISFEFRWDELRQTFNLFRARNLHFDRLNADFSRETEG